MSLDQATVYKCLEKKTLVLGFEVLDLFAMSVLLCVLNFIFASSSFKLFLTFGPVAVLAFTIRIMKIGKAENHLLHWVRFQFAPGILRAWPLSMSDNLFLQMKKKGAFQYARFNARKPS